VSQSYDVTSPDGSIGINVVAEERTEYASGTRLYIDVYKNDQLVAVYRVGYQQDDTSPPVWFDTDIVINSKTPSSGANYNELRVSATDQADNITVDLVIRVYNDMVAFRFENIPNGIIYPEFATLEIGDDTVIVSQPVNKDGEAGLEKGTLNSIGSANSNVARKMFLIDLSKKFAIVQLTMKYMVMDASIDPTATSGVYDFRIKAWPVYASGNPNKMNITETDWVAMIFWDKLDEIRKVVESHVSDFVTVKTFDRQIIRLVLTYDWYIKDIDETKVKNMADIVAEMGVNALVIDNGWQTGTSATQVDTSKFPNGLAPVINYIHSKGLKAGIHVYFEGILNDGIDNCINTWKSWGLGAGDIIKIGFINTYIYDTKDNYASVNALRQIVDRLYQEGFIVILHEFRTWAFSLEYQNVIVEIWWEATYGYQNGNIYNIVEALWKYVDVHDVDTDGNKQQGQTRITIPTASLFGAMMYSYVADIVLDEWQSLDTDTKNLVRSLIQNKNLVDTVELYDNYIIGRNDKVIVVTAFNDVTINIDVPFDGYKITSGTGGTGLVKTPITAGTQSISLSANDSVIFVSSDVLAKPTFSIVGYPSQISGSPGESKSFQVEVSNDGDENGDVILRIKDHNGNIVFSEQKTIPAGTCYLWNVTITLPSTVGTYTWSIEAYNVNTSSVDDSKSFTVEVSGFSWEQLLQMFMQWLPWILMIMFIVLMVSLLTAALR